MSASRFSANKRMGDEWPDKGRDSQDNKSFDSWLMFPSKQSLMSLESTASSCLYTRVGNWWQLKWVQHGDDLNSSKNTLMLPNILKKRLCSVVAPTLFSTVAATPVGVATDTDLPSIPRNSSTICLIMKDFPVPAVPIIQKLCPSLHKARASAWRSSICLIQESTSTTHLIVELEACCHSQSTHQRSVCVLTSSTSMSSSVHLLHISLIVSVNADLVKDGKL